VTDEGGVRWSLPRTSRHLAHQVLLESQRTRRSYLRLRPPLLARAPSGGTALVVEGFPRSANTYFVGAILLKNPHVAIAHHLHSHASLRWAVEAGKPAVVLLREPREAIASLVMKLSIHPRAAIWEYLQFHNHVRPLLKNVIVVPFAAATENPGRAVESINERFGTGLAPYDKERDGPNAVADLVLSRHIETHGRLDPRGVALPHLAKSHVREQVLRRIDHEHTLRECNAVYGVFRREAPSNL
jgi:hypothetical protein